MGIDKRVSFPPVVPMRKGVLELENLSGNVNKKIIICQNDGSLSLFLSSYLEDGLQGDEGDPLRSAMFVFNETESQSKTKVSISNDDILCNLTEGFLDYELCDPKINRNLANEINEVCSRKRTSDKLKIRLNKYLRPGICDQLSPSLAHLEILSTIPTHNRNQDVKLQKLQKFLLKSAYPIVKILGSILTSSQNNQEMLQQTAKAITKKLN